MWSESASETSMSSSDIRSLRDNECRRERRWKLCLSFSLLLFLFVSVVGIIAWSISIELNTKQALAPYARMAQHWQMQRPQSFEGPQLARKYIQYQRDAEGSRRRQQQQQQAAAVASQKQQASSNAEETTPATVTEASQQQQQQHHHHQKHDSHSSGGHNNHEEEKMAEFDYVPAAIGAAELDNDDNKLSMAVGKRAETEPEAGERQPTATQQVMNELGERNSSSPASDNNKGELSADDELGFEVIASAISRSLSAKDVAAKSQSAEQQQEGDSGRLDLSSPSDDNGYELAAAAKTSPRQQSPGAQVAEVIDHLVKSRKRSELSMKGPQIVVVAPVDSSAMRARSLVLEAQAPQEKAPVLEDKRIVASLKKGLIKGSAGERKLAAFKGQLGRKKPIGGRLLGAPTLPVGPNGQLVKFSERVDVIEDEQPFPVMFIHQQPDKALGPAAAMSAAVPDNEMVESQPSASIHVSATQPDEPRLRTPRHGSAPGADLERHLVPVSTISRSEQAEPALHEQHHHQHHQHHGHNHNHNQAKLYSASQVIQEHLLKAKQLHQHRLGAPLNPGANLTTTEASVGRPELSSMAPQKEFREKQFPPEVMQPQHNRQQQHLQEHQQQQQPNMNMNANLNQLPVFPDQEYNVPASMADSLIQDIQSQPANVLPQHFQAPVSQFPVPMHSYNSNKQAIFSQTPSGQQVPVGHQEAHYHQHHHLSGPSSQHQHQQPQNLHQSQSQGQNQYHQAQRPTPRPQQQQPSASISFPKGGGFMNPLARFALRQLLGSVRLQQPLEGPPEPAGASTGPSMQQRAAGGYSSGGAGADVADLKPEGSEGYGRSMPYHEGYGGGGYHEPPSYHQQDNDKNTKGLTFHFGGGPIGGGTQLITSPMGMLKHIMLPLLPSPRVNLNGKVVFGVVLEKTAGFGEPKKKYKFWGR